MPVGIMIVFVVAGLSLCEDLGGVVGGVPLPWACPVCVILMFFPPGCSLLSNILS